MSEAARIFEAIFGPLPRKSKCERCGDLHTPQVDCENQDWPADVPMHEEGGEA